MVLTSVVVGLDPKGIKVAKVLMMKEEILGVDKVTVEEDVVVVAEGCKKTNLVADRNHSQEPTKPVEQSPKFAFTVEQLTGHERKSGDLITLIVGGVAVSDVLIDSGATCNMVGQHTWEMLKLKGIN